jgi:hypothetical protein
METLLNILDWITYKSDNSAPNYALTATLALGFLSYFYKYTHRYTKLLGSLIHEAGHATVALLLGLRVSKIKLDALGNGVTEFYSYSGLRNFPVALAGYIAPPGLALALSYNILNHTLNFALTILIALFIMLTIFVRSWVALLINLLFAFLVYLSFSAAPIVSSLIIFLFAGMLLSSGLMGVRSAYRVRKQEGREAGTDPQVLFRMTLLIPPIVWETLFLLVSLASIVTVVLMLWLPDIML